MKKVAMIAAALLFGASAVFAVEGEVSFENKLSSDIVNISGGEGEFAGITEKVKVEFTSENLDFAVTGKASNMFAQEDLSAGSVFHYRYSLPSYNIDLGKFDDWYVEYRPVQWLTLGWSDDVYAYGSYLPVYDGNVASGNIAAENGFALIFRPIGGLRIGTAIDFGYAVVEYDDSADPATTFNLKWNFGADYTYGELFSFGAAVRNVLADDRSFGVYASLLDLAGAKINLGYSYNDGINGIGGDHLITLGASYGVGAFSVDFDLAWAGDNDVITDDLYLGLLPAFDINDNWGVNCDFEFYTNLSSGDNAADPSFVVHPELTYGVNNHKFGLGAKFEIAGSNVDIAFPVYWKYKFKK